MQSGDDSLRESSPHALETLEGARRYISAFQAPLQKLSTLSPQQISTLWACFFLVIPPLTERMVPQGGFPLDLAELNLSGWAALVQDMVAGLQVLPPNLGHDMGLPMVALLQLLEAATRVGFCHHCCHPELRCKCLEASQPVPPTWWSQIVEQMPGYGVATSSGGMTTPSTSVVEMPGYVVPLPGLTPLNLSIWSLPSLEVPQPRALPAALQCLPGVRRSTQIRATLERHTQAQLAQGPRALAQQAQMPPMLALCTPQMTPPLHQPPPGQPATPYQQMVQLPGKSTGGGVTFDSSANKAVPIGGQGTEGHGRQCTRGREDSSRSASHSRGAQEKSSTQKASRQMPRQEGDLPSGAPPNVPPATAPESTPPQQGGWARTSPRDPLQMVTKYRSSGWKKDLEHTLKVYYKHNVASFKEAEWAQVRDKFFTHLLPHKEEVLGLKEKCPMDFMPYVEEQFWRATGL